MTLRPRRHRRSALGRWASWLGVVGLIVAGVLVAAAGDSSGQAAGNSDAGQDVYAANCAMCHGPDAAGMMGMHPALRGAVERLTVEGVEVTIRNGRQTTPPMPAFADRLSDEQIADVIAYLDTLPMGPRNFGPELSEPGGMMPDEGMMDGGWDGGDVLSAVVLIVLVVVLILGVLMVIQRRRQGPGDGRHVGESPRDILDRRYAAGELSREQFRQAREDLDT